MGTLNDSNYSSASCEWPTPQFLYDELHEEFDFELDVCATLANAKCVRFFGISENGLNQDWSGRVWMNPPYGRGIDQWVQKAFESVQLNADVVVSLLPVRSDTKWWHQFVMRSEEIRLLSRRLSFGGSNKAPFPSAVVVFRGNPSCPRVCSMVVELSKKTALEAAFD